MTEEEKLKIRYLDYVFDSILGKEDNSSLPAAPEAP